MSEKYKLILVDDEDDVRGRILSKIKDDSGFVVVGKAGNGYDALELIEEHSPHIVLTDIKMPFINGIELAKIIKRDYPTTKVAFISGYDEFDYAREAIEQNVLSYLTKPITSNDIDVFLSKVKKQLDEERLELESIASIKEKYDEILPIIGDSYLSSLLLTSSITKSNLEKLKFYGVDVGEGKYLTCMLEVDQIYKREISEIEKYKVRINEILKSKFKQYNNSHSLVIPDGIVLIVNLDSKTVKDVDYILFEVIKTVEDFLKVDIKIGVSKVFDNFNKLPDSFRNAKKALGYGQILDLSRIIYSNELDNIDKEKSLDTIDDIFDIENIIKYGSNKSVDTAINRIKRKLVDQKELFAVKNNIIIIKFANLLIELAGDVEPDIINRLSKLKTIDSFIENISKRIREIRVKDLNNQKSRTEKMLEATIAYIVNNYSDPMLSLEKVCSEMNVSVSHLSMLLKKKKGITFNKFLIKTRLDEAIKLLKTTDMKIADISNVCGYNEVYYFSHSFKKYIGAPPGEYRKNALA